ncbi:methyltransferase domain-containing protein [Ruminococcaceae bacterium OttesenSCG-928-I18]|nr:methyltransferase domain-containing protein [Ruminococcaceae bacterium OttesenSCG-928-I18]
MRKPDIKQEDNNSGLFHRLLGWLRSEKGRELISYGFWGVVSALVTLALFQGFLWLGIRYWVANLFTFIIAKIFIFITNKLFVFRTRTEGIGPLLREFGRFVFSRLATNLVDIFGLIFLVESFGTDPFYTKLVLAIVVIILNYIASKALVFRKSDSFPKNPESLEPKNREYGSTRLHKKLIDRFNGVLMERYCALTARQMPENLLDVGCGEGFTLAMVQKQTPGVHLTGCDISEQALTLAKQLVPKAELQRASVYELPFADDSFDITICLGVLEHLEHPQKALAEIHRVTRGQVLLSVPHAPFFRLPNLLSGKYLATWGTPPAHIQQFRKSNFGRLCGNYFNLRYCLGVFPWLFYEGEKES